jgi:hypothetical protein
MRDVREQNMQDVLENETQSSTSYGHREGAVARTIEQQTARIPSDVFLWAALGSVGVSLALILTGNAKKANFVGHWTPTFLCLGIYNKLVKLHGSDRA